MQDAVDAMLPRIQSLAQSYLDGWAATSAQGNTVKAYPELKRFAFEVGIRCSCMLLSVTC